MSAQVTMFGGLMILSQLQSLPLAACSSESTLYCSQCMLLDCDLALQFKQAAQQIEAEDIADVLEVQAADAEDAQLDDQGDTEAEAAVKAAAAAERQNLAVDAQANSEPKLKPNDPAKANGGLVTGQLPHPLLDGQIATKVTKDVHEADLDMSHADSAPGERCCTQLTVR